MHPSNPLSMHACAPRYTILWKCTYIHINLCVCGCVDIYIHICMYVCMLIQATYRGISVRDRTCAGKKQNLARIKLCAWVVSKYCEIWHIWCIRTCVHTDDIPMCSRGELVCYGLIVGRYYRWASVESLMHICVCMYVCMHICMYNVCIFTRTQQSLHACLFVFTRVLEGTIGEAAYNACMSICMCTYKICNHVWIYVFVYVGWCNRWASLGFLYTCMLVYLYVCR